MGFWDKLRELFSREAADVKRGLESAGKAIDEALAKKEAELAATPDERVEMILEEIEESDADFEALEERIRDQLPGEENPG